MTIALDAVTDSTTVTTDPQNVTHTPVGTPRGVVVLIITPSNGTDEIVGVTYGGVAMTRIRAEHDTAGEPGSVYAYFLGSSIPTGVQTVSVDKSAALLAEVCILTYTAAGDTSIRANAGTSGDQANPSVTLNVTGAHCLGAAALFSGRDTTVDITVGSGVTNIGEQDYGFQSGRFDRQTSGGTSNFTFNYTIVSDDVALVAVAITEGTPDPPPVSAGPVAPPKAVMGTTIDGRPVQLLDWTAEVATNHGDRSLTGILPPEVTWAEQGSQVVIWRGPDDALWSGELTADPRSDRGLLHIRAHGHAEKIAQGQTLPFYRVDGGEHWTEKDAEPHDLSNSDDFDLFTRPNKLTARWGDGSTAFGLNEQAGWIIWIEGGLITRYEAERTSNISITAFDLVTRRLTGPSGTQTTIQTHPLTGTTASPAADITNPEDALIFRVECNSATTPGDRRTMALNRIRVYGRTTNDDFSVADVVADICGMDGIATTNVQGNNVGVLPLLWEDDHPSLLDYMAELADWRWLVRHDGMHFGPYERIWESATDHGAVPDVEPQPRSNVVIQPFRARSGRLRRAVVRADPDPFPDRDFTVYGEELEDPQPDAILATLVAQNRIAHESSYRVAGSVELTEVRERGVASDPVMVDAGDLLQLTDLAPKLGPQRISVATYRQRFPEGRVAVTVQLGDEFNLVRTMRDAERQAKKQRGKK